MLKRFSILFAAVFVSVTAWSLGPGLQGELKKKVPEEAKAVEVGGHDSAARLRAICTKLGMGEEQLKLVKGLYIEISGKMKGVETDKLTRPEQKEKMLENLHDNADRRFRNLCTKPQKTVLEEFLDKERAAYKLKMAQPKAPDKGAPVAAAPAAAGGKICWSCWPGKCDRSRYLN